MREADELRRKHEREAEEEKRKKEREAADKKRMEYLSRSSSSYCPGSSSVLGGGYSFSSGSCASGMSRDGTLH